MHNEGMLFHSTFCKMGRNTTQYHSYNLKIHTKMHSSPLFWLGWFLLQITGETNSKLSKQQRYGVNNLTSSPEVKQLAARLVILWLSCQEPVISIILLYYQECFGFILSAFLIITG